MQSLYTFHNAELLQKYQASYMFAYFLYRINSTCRIILLAILVVFKFATEKQTCIQDEKVHVQWGWVSIRKSTFWNEALLIA